MPAPPPSPSPLSDPSPPTGSAGGRPDRRLGLLPGLPWIWRDRTTLQLGLDPGRAVVLTGVTAEDQAVLAVLDGTAGPEEVVSRSVARGVDEGRARRLLTTLDGAGLLWRASTPFPELQGDVLERDRLAPEWSALAALRRDAGAAAGRRRRAAVEVVGLGRVGSALSLLLAGAGLGRVVPRDDGVVTPQDLLPAAGLDRGALGLPREAAVRAALGRHVPTCSTAALPRRREAQLVVVVASDCPGTLASTLTALVRRAVPHLVLAVRGTTGVVGPFVVPGRTSCVRCLELHRRDRDDAWPRVAAQVSAAGRVVADGVLATLVAAHAAVDVLHVVDTGELPPSADGAVEVDLTEGRVRRRSWGAHPSCGCCWDPAGPAAVTATAPGDGGQEDRCREDGWRGVEDGRVR